MTFKRHDPRSGRGPQHKRPSGGRPQPRRDAPPRHDAPPASTDRLETGCESQYLNSLLNANLELMIVLRQGESIAGQLIWYDRTCLKLAPSDGSPSLLIPKANIKYLYEVVAS
jgi:hypothetical protein